MRVARICVDQPLTEHAEIQLGPAAAGHVSRVLRLGAGDGLTLFDRRGGEYAAKILESHGSTVRVRTGEHRVLERESPLRITLAQGVSRGERMDWVVQKATELGVAAIVPLLTERSVVKLDAQQAEKRLAHWRAIAIGACEQCGRNRVPEIAAPLDLDRWLSAPAGDGERLLLQAGATVTLRSLPACAAVTLLIGPEGGLADHERHLALSTGFQAISLGPRVLRTETAALTALAILQALRGDLGG